MSLTSTSFLHRLVSGPDDVTGRRLTQLYTPLIRAWVSRKLRQAFDVDDVVQEVFKVVLKKAPDFCHNGWPGAFRAWLRAICVNCVRKFNNQRLPASPDAESALCDLEDPDSDLSQQWEREHDEFVLRQTMELIKPEFTTATWEAFRRVGLEGRKAGAVAVELGLTVNAVFIAKSRVLGRLREEIEGLVDMGE